MHRLIDVHAPQHDVCECLVVHVNAETSDVLDVIDRDPAIARDPFAGVKVLGRSRRERLFGLTWSPVPGAGSVDVVWDLRVEAGEDGCCHLSSTRRFIASDDAAREALRSNWRQIRGSADMIARLALRTIKRAAEERAAVAGRDPHAELQLAA